MPLSGLEDDSLEGLGIAFSGLSVGAPEGKEKEKGAVDMGVEVKMNTIHPMRCPSITNLLRARQAPLSTLQHPLRRPLHSQPHIQPKHHAQPLHLWLNV